MKVWMCVQDFSFYAFYFRFKGQLWHDFSGFFSCNFEDTFSLGFLHLCYYQVWARIVCERIDLQLIVYKISQKTVKSFYTNNIIIALLIFSMLIAGKHEKENTKRTDSLFFNLNFNQKLFIHIQIFLVCIHLCTFTILFFTFGSHFRASSKPA